MPSTAELNAAFDAIQVDLHQLVQQFVPFYFKSQALAQLESREGRAMVLDGVTKALTAAEHVRATPALKKRR